MNKAFYVILGVLVGYFIAKNRLEKKISTQAEKISNDVTNTVATAVDNALAVAEQNNLSVSEVRGVLNGNIK